jgi:exportin-T
MLLFILKSTRGVHNQNSTVRSRVFYLFHRFIKEGRNDMPVEIVPNVIEGLRDLLQIQVELPELENENPTQQEILTEAAANPGIFDSQLYLFETVGILLSLLFKTPERQAALLLSIVKPLLDDLSVNLQLVTKDSQNVIAILTVHHTIMALGNVAKGFPDFPSPVPEGYILPPLDVFAQVAQAILVCLEAMNVFKVVRDAVGDCNLLPAHCELIFRTDTVCFCEDFGDHRAQRNPFHTTSNGQPPRPL